MASDTSNNGRLATGRAKRPRLTCVNCRNRKIRCDGAQPSCGICTAYSESCFYDKPPPMSQVIAMVEKLKELEDTIEELKNNNDKTISVQDPGPSHGDRAGAPPSTGTNNQDSSRDTMHLDQSR